MATRRCLRVGDELRQFDVRLREIFALEQQRHAKMPGAGISETIAEIQRRGMLAFSEALEGFDGEAVNVGRKRGSRDPGRFEKIQNQLIAED